MQVSALALRHFRNLRSIDFVAEERLTIFYGENGQGKTNIIEALFLLGTLKSFRANRIDELIEFGQSEATLAARVSKFATERKLELQLTPGHKRARVDGKAARPSDYYGGVNMVLFGPEELELVRGSPSVRRRFMDRAIWNLTPPYIEQVSRYERVLRSRSSVLRDEKWQSERDALLAVYDGELAKAAVPLVMARQHLVENLRPLAERAMQTLMGLGLQIEIRSAWLDGKPEATEIEAILLERLVQDRARDIGRGSTSAGPHTDELLLTLDGKPAAVYGSQGQVRTLALALKFAEIELLHASLGDMPVLLLDDVSSELDRTRNEHLFAHLDQIGCQTFVTTTHPSHVLVSKNRKDYQVVSGAIVAR